MILFEKPEGEFRCCACCHSRENVLEIIFQSEGHGLAIALCDKCRKELAKNLKKVTNSANAKKRTNAC